MDNLMFVDEEDIPLVLQDDEDCDNYNAPDTSWVETSFIEHDTTEPTSTLRQKVKRDKLTAVYRYVDVTGDIDLIDIDQLMIKKIPKQATLTCFFSMVMNNGNLPLINVLVTFYQQRH